MIRSSVAVTTGWLLGTVIILVATFLLLPLFTDVSSPFSKMDEVAPTLGAGWFAVEMLITVGAGFTGGFVAALIATDHPVAHGAGLAVIVLVLGVASAVFGTGLRPLWQDLIVTLLGAVAAVAGSTLLMQPSEDSVGE